MPEIKFHKGDLVKFRFGIYFLQGVVKEDRGPIGINGRHLYRIEYRFGPHAESDSHIELPAEKLQLVQDTVAKE